MMREEVYVPVPGSRERVERQGVCSQPHEDHCSNLERAAAGCRSQSSFALGLDDRVRGHSMAENVSTSPTPARIRGSGTGAERNSGLLWHHVN